MNIVKSFANLRRFARGEEHIPTIEGEIDSLEKLIEKMVDFRADRSTLKAATGHIRQIRQMLRKIRRNDA